MRTLFLQLFTICALFIPLTQVEARTPKPPPVFGGWSPGKTFTFTVTNVTSTGNQGGQIINPAPIPKGVPAFVNGQQVTFTIGKKGELKGPGFSVAFQAESATANVYVNKPARGAQPTTATVNKNTTTGEPTAISMAFFSFKLVKRIPNVTQVYYTIQ